jgi:hypothetical protein
MGLGSGIRYPEITYSGSRIQRSKRHRIPDPGSGSAKLPTTRGDEIMAVLALLGRGLRTKAKINDSKKALSSFKCSSQTRDAWKEDDTLVYKK